MGFLQRQGHFICLLAVELKDVAPVEDWNAWYDEVHAPDMLSVSGSEAVRRYAQRDNPPRFLAGYEIAGPGVFDEPRCAEVTGWDPCALRRQPVAGGLRARPHRVPGPQGGRHPVAESLPAAERLS